ncbi:hypothetical protein PIROE2DRAFT_14997, partial [Piromyces sp. E2]
YIINNNQYIQCNGWKREGCIVETIQEPPSDETCTNTNNERKLLSNFKRLCFGVKSNSKFLN